MSVADLINRGLMPPHYLTRESRDAACNLRHLSPHFYLRDTNGLRFAVTCSLALMRLHRFINLLLWYNGMVAY